MSESNQELNVDKNKLKLIVLLLFILVVIFTYFTYYTVEEVNEDVVSDSKYFEFEDHLFIQNDFDAWDFNVENRVNGDIFTVSLRNLPTEVEHVPVKGDPSTFWAHKSTLYLAFDPSMESSDLSKFGLSMVDLTLSLSKVFGVKADTACTSEGDGCKRVIESCMDSDLPRIQFIKSNETKILEQNTNCLEIYGTADTISQATEKLLYMWYDVLR